MRRGLRPGVSSGGGRIAGFLLETLRGLMRVLPDKQALLLEQAASLGLEGVLSSERERDRIKGRHRRRNSPGRRTDRLGCNRLACTMIVRRLGP